MRSILMLVILLFELYCNMGFECGDDYCDTVVCETIVKCGSNQILEENATTCGCCSQCINIISKIYCL